MTYNSETILWVKSVKRDSGSAWAYEELNCENGVPQKLHWRTDIGETSAKHPAIGDIILLFQTVNFGPSKNSLRLTHLVSPVSNDVLPDYKNTNFKWYREVRVIAKADPIYIIPKPVELKFNKVGNGGMTFGIHLLSADNISIPKVQELIWNAFEPYMCSASAENIISIDTLAELSGASEGDTYIITHLQLELRYRNSEIVKQKKKLAFDKGNGKIKCECCGFDFLETYNLIGTGFIECHHKKFLSSGERITKLEDLALICSNCHRMLHRKKEDDSYFSVEELKALIQKQKR